MKMKKIIAGAAAAALAVSMTAFSVSAETIAIDSEYPGDWTSTGIGITKEALQAVGGDVKITLDVELYDPYGLADQYLVCPIDYDNGWLSQSKMEDCHITTDTLTIKSDGWICVNKNDTQLEFVLDADAIDAMGDTGLTFSVKSVVVKQCTYELGEKEGEPNWVDDKGGKEYCFADLDAAAPVEEEAAPEETEAAVEETEAPAEEEAAPAETEAAPAETEAAPAAAEETTPAATGNAVPSVIVTVMGLAAAAMVAARRR
ncbi:MAG: hypothetical protein II936_05640 [Oscillospiraceae bacterium]|nr:hypothetical protein [Oscillospiraceae bacterium]